MKTASDLCLVLTTWPADQPVETFAARLVSERLAACVSVSAPMTSHYWWQGAIERADERQVLIKTRRALVAALEARLPELHPYQVPELLVLDAAASATYGVWVRDSTSG